MNGVKETISLDPLKLDDVERVTKVVRTGLGLAAGEEPSVGIICGSGLGGLADTLTNPRVLPYAQIPSFPQPKVAGHKGALVYGELAGRKVICQQGRFHHYEGHPMAVCALPVRVMKLLGVKVLVITNAAGGINREFSVGDLMLIKDHIFLPALCSKGPLYGPNDPRMGPRFVSLNNLYDQNLRKLAHDVAKVQDIGLQEGIFAMQTGPQYETPAELRMFHAMGVDAVGMSVCHEAVAARHMGVLVLAVSLITNIAEMDSDAPANNELHEEVLEEGKKAAEKAATFVTAIVEKLEL